MMAPVWHRAMLYYLLLPSAALSLPSAQDSASAAAAAAANERGGTQSPVSKLRDWGSLLLSSGAFATGAGALALNWRNSQRIKTMEDAAGQRDTQMRSLGESVTAYRQQLEALGGRIAELEQKAAAGDTTAAAHASELQALRQQHAAAAERLAAVEAEQLRQRDARTTAEWARKQVRRLGPVAARQQAVQLFVESHDERDLHRLGRYTQAFREIDGRLPPGLWNFRGLGECIRSKLQSLGYHLSFDGTDVPKDTWSAAATFCVGFLGLSPGVAHGLELSGEKIRLVADPDYPSPSLPDEESPVTPPPDSSTSERQFLASSAPGNGPARQPFWRAALQQASKGPRMNGPNDFSTFFGVSGGRVPPRRLASRPALRLGLGKPF